ncbi:DUF4037 domain-containing protein [Catellatospora chokoriensis]|nr:DUF4037 domain-containing protein [Catellatospora chokoriensis]
MPEFVPGLELCRVFYVEAVRPLLDEAFPGLAHAAARVGAGSEVLGFDTARSTDHDWGPRLELFLSPADVARCGADVSELLARRLPKRVLGWSTHFAPPDARVRVMADTHGPVAHQVVVTEVGGWSAGLLGFDGRAQPSARDWLAAPTQILAEVTGGAVYHDGPGELTALRRRLAWYPDDVWRYVLACQWTRIAQEEAFVGRSAQAGDELGSRVNAARLAREVMRLCLLLARRYPPYGKWLGRAFGQVPQAAGVAAALRAALAADEPGPRQDALCDAYEAAGGWQNTLGLAEVVDARRRPFHDRPFPVIGADRFAAALTARIADPWLAGLTPVGAVDQFVDSTDVLCRPAAARAVTAAAYEVS